MTLPSREALRRELAAFDETRKKIVGGVLAVMFRSPERVKDREWIVEQFTQVTLVAVDTGALAEELAGSEHAHEAAATVQEYVRTNIDDVLNACYALFLHVADDLREKDGDAPSAEDALLRALSYFEGPGC